MGHLDSRHGDCYCYCCYDNGGEFMIIMTVKKDYDYDSDDGDGTGNGGNDGD
jgi:hypothetical protein